MNKYNRISRIFLTFFFTLLCGAAIVRFWKIGLIPYALDGDEAAFGYYAFSITSHGTDEFGNRLPIYFPSIGDYKFPAYVYLSTVWVKVLGLSETSTRTASAVAGIFTVALTVVLAAHLAKNLWSGLMAGGILAISPWHVMLSRGAYEVNLGVFMATLAVTLGVRSFPRHPVIRWGLITLFALTGAYSYSAVRLFLVCSGTVLGFCQLFKGNKKAGIYLLILTAGGLLSFLPKESRVRASSVSAISVSRAEIVEHVGLAEHEDGISQFKIPLTFTRVIHNKYITVGFDLTKRFMDHVNPAFLFVDGDPRSKFKTPGTGLLLLITAPFLLYGLVEGWGRKITWVLLVWWLLATIPTSMTLETPNMVRYLPAVVPIVILMGNGMYEITMRGKKHLRLMFLTALVAAVSLNTAYFLHQYFTHKTYHHPWYSDGGMKEMVAAVTKFQNQYPLIVVPDDPYIFFLFYNRMDSNQFLSEADINPANPGQDWERVNRWKNIVFKMPTPCPKIGKTGILYVCQGTEIPLNSRLIESIRFSDSVPAYSLVEFYPAGSEEDAPLPQGLTRMKETDFRFGPHGNLPADFPTPWL